MAGIESVFKYFTIATPKESCEVIPPQLSAGFLLNSRDVQRRDNNCVALTRNTSPAGTQVAQFLADLKIGNLTPHLFCFISR
jgi:hypothetical protein